MHAADAVAHTDMIMVNDCDHCFRYGESFESLEQLFLQEIDGLLWTFKSESPNYSFVQTDENALALRTAEKLVISDKAIAGIYCFKSFETVAKVYSDHKQLADSGELYISKLFDLLIQQGGVVKVSDLEEHIAFGTPTELIHA